MSYQSQLPPEPLKLKPQYPYVLMRWIMLITLLTSILISVSAGIVLAFVLKSPMPLVTTALLTAIKPIVDHLFPSRNQDHKK